MKQETLEMAVRALLMATQALTEQVNALCDENAARALAELDLFDSVRGTVRGIAMPYDGSAADGWTSVAPGALVYSVPMPLRLDHRHTIGVVRSARETSDGIEIEATVADSRAFASPTIRERLDKVWSDLEAGRCPGFSCGYFATDAQVTEKSQRRVTAGRIYEVSIASPNYQPKRQGALIKSVEPVEKRIEDVIVRRSMRFTGPYRAGARYKAGDVAQYRGTLFIALEDTDDAPGKSSDWRLMVKHAEAEA